MVFSTFRDTKELRQNPGRPRLIFGSCSSLRQQTCSAVTQRNINLWTETQKHSVAVCVDDFKELLDLFSAYLCGIIGSAVSLEVQKEVDCRLSFSWTILFRFLTP